MIKILLWFSINALFFININASAQDDLFFKGEMKQVLIKNTEIKNQHFIPLSILPHIAKDRPNFPLEEMSNWSNIKRNSYHLEIQNSFGEFGGTIAELDYHIDFQFGGTFLGLGQYLNAINISVENLYVAGGLELDTNIFVLSVSNIGTTKEPIAAITFQIEFITKRLFKTEITSEVYFISGNGKFYKL